MNFDVRTLAFTRNECSLLAGLLIRELPTQIHAIHTSSMMATEKTKAICKLVDEHVSLRQMLVWTTTDTAAHRAYRQVITGTVMRLREVMHDADLDTMTFEEIRSFRSMMPSITVGLDRALMGDMGRAPLKQVSLKNPQAKA